MIRVKPKSKRFLYYFVGILAFYFLFIRTRVVTQEYEVVIDNVNPKDMWEFWADFSNYQKINPTILNFEIEYEKGSYDNWEYGVSYWEDLTLLPFKVHMRAVYVVTPEQVKGHFKQPYRITSTQKACVWIFCTHVESDMTFTAVGKTNTRVTEVVKLACSWIFQSYQIKEFKTQRQHITQQLREIDFSNT